MNEMIIHILNYWALSYKDTHPHPPILQMRKQRLIKVRWLPSASIQNLAPARPGPLRASDHKTPTRCPWERSALERSPWLVIYLQIQACGIDSEFMRHTQVFRDSCSWNFIRPPCNCGGKCLRVHKLLLGKPGKVSLHLWRRREQVPEFSQQTKEPGSDSLRAGWCPIDNTISCADFEAPDGSSFLSMKNDHPLTDCFCKWFNVKSLMTIDSWSLFSGGKAQDTCRVSGRALFWLYWLQFI